MKKLNVKSYKLEGKQKELIFESEDVQTAIEWLITILYDGNIKRCKCKIKQYYEGGTEYCEVKGIYVEYHPYTDMQPDKYEYIVSGICNDWGNFINMTKTFIDNKIEIKGGE